MSAKSPSPGRIEGRLSDTCGANVTPVIDLDGALAWAGAAIGSPVASHERLQGGLTSRMVALRHADGSESVLRLMINEPWRTHGAGLTTREREAQLSLAGPDVAAAAGIARDAAGAAGGGAGPRM